MSCRRILLAVAVAVSVTARAAQASWLIGADAGVGVPTGTFHDLWSTGFSGQLSASYLINPRVAAGLDVSYSKFGTASGYQALLDFIHPRAGDHLTPVHYGVHRDHLVPVRGGSKLNHDAGA